MGLILTSNLKRSNVNGGYERMYEAYGEESVIENAIECENELAAITESFFKSDALELQLMKKEAGFEMDYVTEASLINSREELEVVQENIMTKGLEKLKAIWIKIKEATIAFFTALGAKVGAIFMDNKKFLAKFGKHLTGEVEIKGCMYDVAAVDKVIAAVGLDNIMSEVSSISGAKDLAGLADEDKDELVSIQEKAKSGLEELVKAISGKAGLSGCSTIGEFKKAIVKAGKGEKESAMKVTADQIKTALEADIKKERADITKEIGNVKKEFTKKVSELDSAAKKLKKGEGNTAAVVAATKAITELVNKGRVMTIAAHSTKRAIIGRKNAQFKRAAAKMVAKNVKPGKDK